MYLIARGIPRGLVNTKDLLGTGGTAFREAGGLYF